MEIWGSWDERGHPATPPRGGGRTGSPGRLKINDDLTEVFAALKRPERLGRIRKGICGIDYRFDGVTVDCLYHSPKHGPRPHGRALQPCIFSHERAKGQHFFSASQHPDNGNVSAQPDRVEALREVPGTAHAKNEIDPRRAH